MVVSQLWSTSLTNTCERVQFSVKLRAEGSRVKQKQKCLFYPPVVLFLNDLNGDLLLLHIQGLVHIQSMNALDF